jgi:hypothetical protein
MKMHNTGITIDVPKSEVSFYKRLGYKEVGKQDAKAEKPKAPAKEKKAPLKK